MNSLLPALVRARDRRGVAIVIVLWVVLVLSLLISGFAFTMHVETQVASFARKQLKAEMLARSGIEVARMELILHEKSPTESSFDAPNQEWATNEELYVNHELGDGTYNVKVTDEESKIPLNTVTDAQLKRLFNLLGVDPTDGDIMTDSILDWREPGDLTRLNGAKNDYYQSLSPPYRAKNGPFDRVEELLLVRGVTPELFNGSPATEDREAIPALSDLFTTLSNGRINVNTASATVLQAVLGLDDVHAQAILNYRDGSDGIAGTDDDQPFQDPNQFARMAGTLDPSIQGLVGVQSSTFTVTSTGTVGGVKRTVIATLRRDGEDVKVVAWREVRGGT
jgi:general secretion pathway protein K